MSFVFKSMDAQFLKRAETDVLFSTCQGGVIKEALERSIEMRERINRPIEVIARNTMGETIAKFVMIASVKVLDKNI